MAASGDTDATAAVSAWAAPPGAMRIQPGEVHVWRARLALPPRLLARLAAALSPEERARASRLGSLARRSRFEAKLGIQRHILARYLAVTPADIVFRYSRHGKPEAAAAGATSGLRFNVASSAELAVYALALGREVGVDVEAIRPLRDAASIVERFFSEHERAAYGALPPVEREAAFFRGWTRKEAYVKARGEGLSFALDGFDVTLASAEPARLLAVRGDPAETGRWTMIDLDPGEGWAAALVVEGDGIRLRRFDWTDSMT